ncbi:hypothetical protein [Flagellimonas allohymeniacidonis]|uniref:Uncharacterized protein n=1 Tax=Flagellimonas allohymeniacidonis TaxID=2517819 RepID=A0A4Q8QEV8_9FLAO|nr:hypothetical protein [Allomuricauda hymeniacidonis]TAI48991.1 hypothetical protein EW142_04125 [Allomuricauda hymeniacidonis]
MTRHYLDIGLKKYYDRAYQEVKTSGNVFWSLDEGLAPFLEEINSNEHIQTIYSKRGPYMGGFKLYSYVAIAYSQKVELSLFRNVIPIFISKYNELRDGECIYEYRKPYKREDKEKDVEVLDLMCIKDPNYFNVHHIRLELKGIGHNTHNEFWVDLAKYLSEIK